MPRCSDDGLALRLLSDEVGRDVPSSEAFAVLMAVLTSSVSARSGGALTRGRLQAHLPPRPQRHPHDVRRGTEEGRLNTVSDDERRAQGGAAPQRSEDTRRPAGAEPGP